MLALAGAGCGPRSRVIDAGLPTTTAALGAHLAYGDLAGNIHLATPAEVRAALANAAR